MSDDFRENGHVRALEDTATDQLPADLEAIYNRLAWDSAGWARRLPNAAPLQDYLRVLSKQEATVDVAAHPVDAAVLQPDRFDLTDEQPERTASGGSLGATHAHPSRRAVWGGAVSAVAVVALLAATFAILPHPHGGNRLTKLTPTTTPTCAPNQITLTVPDHTELTQIDMTSPTEGWALGRTWSEATINSAYPTSHPLLVRFHQCHWTPVPDPVPGADVNLRNISMATAEDGWAAGAESSGATVRCVLLHYTEGQWQRVALPPQVQGRSSCELVRMSSPDEGWLLGRWGSSTTDFLPRQLLHYVKGTWTGVESPIPNLLDLETTGPDDLWVAGTRPPTRTDPDRFVQVNVAHYWHGQWTTFQLAARGGISWFHMSSPLRGWLVNASLPFQVLHFDGTTWQQSPFNDHVPADGMVNVFDHNDVWNIAMIDGRFSPQVTGMQHYVNGQWQTVQWPFPDVFVRTQLTRTVPGEYWTVGVRAIGQDWRTWKWVALYYTGGAWHEYGA